MDISYPVKAEIVLAKSEVGQFGGPGEAMIWIEAFKRIQTKGAKVITKILYQLSQRCLIQKVAKDVSKQGILLAD